MDKKNVYRAVSLFSGAGGLDYGAKRASVDIIWANDMSPHACETYRKNIGDHICCGDIDVLSRKLNGMSGVDIVLGGPPCQGYSVAGNMDPMDKRSKLVWSYVRIVGILKPQAFIMENVKALGEFGKWDGVRRKLVDSFREMGYSTGMAVINACDFGVPQSRERVFFIGFRGNPDIVPDIAAMMSDYRHPGKTVREALAVLDRAGTGNNTQLCNAAVTLARHPVPRKSPYAGLLLNGGGRPMCVDGYAQTLVASMGGNRTPVIDERALYENEECWFEEYLRIVNEDPEYAWMEIVPDYVRRLTVDEAAVLQTFPLSYEFCGPQQARYSQIGNAVPCELAYAVCSMVTDVLSGKRSIVRCSENII